MYSLTSQDLVILDRHHVRRCIKLDVTVDFLRSGRSLRWIRKEHGFTFSDNELRALRAMVPPTGIPALPGRTMRILRFICIILAACSPLRPDLSLTWKEAWRRAGKR